MGFNDVSDIPQEDWEMVIKVQGITKANLVTVLKPLVKKIKDARKM